MDSPVLKLPRLETLGRHQTNFLISILSRIDLGTNQKGRFLNIGLWMQSTDSLDSMLKVMKWCVVRSSELGPCLIFFPQFIHVRLNLLLSRVPIWPRKTSTQVTCYPKKSKSGALQAIRSILKRSLLKSSSAFR